MVSHTTASPPDLHNANTSKKEEEFRTFLDVQMDTYFAVESVVSIIIIPSVCVFGIFANVANIIVFVKMGFQETTNIMFLALSLSDLILVTGYAVSTSGMNGIFDNVNTLFWNIWDFINVIFPIIWAFIGYGSFTTALIAVERSVCIVLPLKVKTIFTPRRITVILVCFLAFPVVFLAQKYALMELNWETNPVTNETRLRFVYLSEEVIFDHVALFFFNTAPSLTCFLVVAVGTAVMVVKLNQSARWRKTSAQGAQHKGASAKEVKVVRSVVIVCSVFIICFLPNVLIGLIGVVYQKFHISDAYFGPFQHICFSFSHLFQAISSSVNICIYLTTSTKYKQIFLQVFLSFREKA